MVGSPLAIRSSKESAERQTARRRLFASVMGRRVVAQVRLAILGVRQRLISRRLPPIRRTSAPYSRHVCCLTNLFAVDREAGKGGTDFMPTVVTRLCNDVSHETRLDANFRNRGCSGYEEFSNGSLECYIDPELQFMQFKSIIFL